MRWWLHVGLVVLGAVTVVRTQAFFDLDPIRDALIAEAAAIDYGPRPGFGDAPGDSAVRFDAAIREIGLSLAPVAAWAEADVQGVRDVLDGVASRQHVPEGVREALETRGADLREAFAVGRSSSLTAPTYFLALDDLAAPREGRPQVVEFETAVPLLIAGFLEDGRIDDAVSVCGDLVAFRRAARQLGPSAWRLAAIAVWHRAAEPCRRALVAASPGRREELLGELTAARTRRSPRSVALHAELVTLQLGHMGELLRPADRERLDGVSRHLVETRWPWRAGLPALWLITAPEARAFRGVLPTLRPLLDAPRPERSVGVTALDAKDRGLRRAATGRALHADDRMRDGDLFLDLFAEGLAALVYLDRERVRPAEAEDLVRAGIVPGVVTDARSGLPLKWGFEADRLVLVARASDVPYAYDAAPIRTQTWTTEWGLNR